jgi:ankyrin repeat protein
MVNANSDSNNTPLHLTAREGHEAVVQRLTQNGAEGDSKESYGITPLHICTRDDHEAIV